MSAQLAEREDAVEDLRDRVEKTAPQRPEPKREIDRKKMQSIYIQA
jgi:hypothetical protein